MTCFITAAASIVSTLRGMKTRSWAWSSMYLIMLLFLDMTMELACIWTMCDGLKLLGFRYLWTRVVITMWTPMYEVLVSYLWNGCNMWLVMLNHYDLGCMQVGLISFMVSVDYWGYMGSSMMVWSLRWLLSYLCSYKLVGSVIAGIRARFNIKHVICVFKTKVFVCKNQFWQLVATYI